MKTICTQKGGDKSFPMSSATSVAIRIFTMFLMLMFTNIGFGQTFPSASSCTSKDLELREASLPVSGMCNPATGSYPLELSIYNKTGSTRTACALWGTLIIRDINGNPTPESGKQFYACIGPVAKASLTKLPSKQMINYVAGYSYEITNIFLAWTTSNSNENCSYLEANLATIAPKCGTQASLKINVGVEAAISVPPSTCDNNGSIVTVTAKGGTAPYRYSRDNENYSATTSTPYTFPQAFAPGSSNTIWIKDASNCAKSFTFNVAQNTIPTAEAGASATMNCTSAPFAQLGESDGPGSPFRYTWTSNNTTDDKGGLSATDISNPIATPSKTTTYKVRKTNINTGCYAEDVVTVTVDNARPAMRAGTATTLNCTNTTAAQLGETPENGFNYTWSSTNTTDANGGLSAINIGNPTANPTITTTYTVKKTNPNNGCYIEDAVTISVNRVTPSAAAGSDVTLNCNSTSAAQLGEALQTGMNYAWSSNNTTDVNGGLSATNTANPTANPTVSTTYTVKKTNPVNGCYSEDVAVVTVDKTTTTVNAGSDVTLNCNSTAAAQLGETTASGFSYTWTSANTSDVNGGLSATNTANPTANPTVSSTYTVTKTNTTNGCSATDQVTVTINKTQPSFSVCIVQPTLCAKGALTFNATGGAGFEYSLDGGATYSSVSNVFSNLGAGSVTGLKVRNSYGCVSATFDCSSVSQNCPQPSVQPAPVLSSQTSIATTMTKQSDLTVKAYPNPFSNKLSFSVESPLAGQGSIELFNMSGQKITTVFQGRIPAGVSNYQVYLPMSTQGILAYVLKVEGKSVSGKVMSVKK